MAFDLTRRFFGYGPADFAVTIDPATSSLVAQPGVVGTVFQAMSGSATFTDLLTAANAPATTVTADAEGRVAFWGPPGVTELFVDFGDGRFRMTSVTSTTDPSSAVWLPSDVTGATDMTSELEAFRTANPGRSIRVQAGATIKLGNAFAGVTTGDIVLDLTGATVLYDASLSSGCAIKADNTSAASAEVTVSSIAMATVNTDAYVSRLTLAATLSAAPFDWLALYSADANPAVSGGQLGEIVQVLSAESSLQVPLARRLNRHGSYTATVRARKLSAVRKFRLRGGTFRASGNPEDTAITTRAAAIKVLGFVDPVVEDVDFDRPWAPGVWFQACAAPRAANLRIRDVSNVAGNTTAVLLYGMNDAADVRGLVARNAASAFATDGDSSSTTTWYAKGIPTNATVDGVHGHACRGAVIATREEGDGLTFLNVEAEHDYRDAGGVTGTAVQLLAANCTVRGLTVRGGTRGVRVGAVNHGFEDRVVLDDLRVTDTTHANDGDIGVQIDDQSALANRRHVIIKGDFDNVGIAIQAGKKSKVTLPRASFRRCKVGVDAGAGADVVFTGNPEFDYRLATRTAPYQPIVARSDAVNGGCSVVSLQPVQVIKGTTASPTVLVTEADVTAAKKLWIPEVLVLDQSSSGTPTVIATTATTFDPALVYRVAGYFTDNGPGGPGDGGPTGATYPQELLPAMTSFELTLPTGSAGNPDDVYQSALATYADPSWFHLNTVKDGVEMAANAGGTATSGSSYARSEFREMQPGYTSDTQKAAWDANDGNTHTMTVTQAINQLPVNRPLMVCGQIHAGGSQSYLLIVADGFRPSTTTTAVTGTSTQPFTLMCKINDATSTQRAYVPILTNYVMGQTFTLKLEAINGVVNVYCDLGNTATTLRYTDSTYVPTGAVNYFKAGAYLQSNTTNGQTVPNGSGPGGADLTNPVHGSTIAGDAADVVGKVTIKALNVSHATTPGGITPIAYPADLMGQFWKVTLPTTPVSEVLQSDFKTFSSPSSFYLTAAKDGVVFSARCNAGTTSNSSNPRSELREMTGSPNYTTEAAWTALTGSSVKHTMIYTASVDELPVKKPEVVVGQIHAKDDGSANYPDDQLVVLASGFYPTSGRVACTGTDTTIGFDLRLRWLGSVKLAGAFLPVLISNLHIGEKFSIKFEVTGSRYRVWAKKDPTGAEDFSGVSEATASVNLTLSWTGPNYFKLGDYVQSNMTNSNKSVPYGTCAGGLDLLTPAAGSSTGGDASTAGGRVTVYGNPTVTHA